MENSRLVSGLISLVLCMVFLAIPAGNVYAMPFKAADNYTVGTSPWAVAVGDFDLDGQPDLATANYSSNNVSILLSDSDGTFSAAPDSPMTVGANPLFIAVADFNRDGKPDLAVANYDDGNGNVSILLGDGDGTFTAATESPVATLTGPQCVAVGDFDRDGDPDLAVVNYWADKVHILIGHGDGTFSAPGDCAVGSHPQKAAVGDFNRDGKPDLAVTNDGSGTVSILLGNGDGTFSAAAVSPAVGSRPLSVAVGDFNRDGIPDLATANYNDGNVSILIGTGTGAFAAAENYPVGAWPHIVSVGDFNMDGAPDLATANEYDSDVSILLNDGDGTFGTKTDYAAGASPYSVAVGDFNRDGAPDLAVANAGSGTVSVLLNKTAAPSVSFNAAVNYTVGTGPYAVAAGDFNRDGKPDLAVANDGSGNVSILLGDGLGTFAAAAGSPVAVGTNPRSVAVGDFNLDGKPDLAAANYSSNNVSILLGVGNGTFGTADNCTVGTNPSSVAVGDFNRDGAPDLAVANGNNGNVSILLGVDDGTFNPAVPPSYAVGTTPVSVAVGDFNRDGKPDLAAANNGSNNVSILLGDGDGTFAAASNCDTASQPDSVAVGDFNRDGKPDLAVVNGSGNVSILLGVGNGTFNPAVPPTYAVGAWPMSVAVGDFNRDGNLDLAVANNYYEGSNDISILLGVGNGTFGTAVNYAAGLHPISVAAGDFNRDGRPDLAVANNNDGYGNDVSILLNSSLAGNVFAWGDNWQGELGDNSEVDRNVPGRVHGVSDSGYLNDITAIAAGLGHSLAVKSDGSVWAWGWNEFGQLGDGTYNTSYTPVQVKDTTGDSYLTGITAVSARGQSDSSPRGIHSLARKSDGTVYAWGNNTYGQLGDGTNTTSNKPVQVSGLTSVTAIAAGRVHSLALKSDGTVWAWGWNGFGQLGEGTNSDNNTPVQVHGVDDSGHLTDIIAIAAGYDHSLAVKSDGTVYAWGRNASGELGDGTNGNSNTPVQVFGLTGAVTVAGGGDRCLGSHSLAVKSDGTVWAWGYNGCGQLGNGNTSNSNVPVQVHGLNDSGYLSGVKDVAAGAWHSLALKSDGTVWAWGYNGTGPGAGNGTGALGNGNNINSSTPVQVTDMSDVVAISAGSQDSMALIGSGKAITAFDFNTLTPAVIGTVDEGLKTVALTVPAGTDVTALVPTIIIHGSSVSPLSGVAQDFTSSVTYTVTAADASEQAYVVTVTFGVAAPTVTTDNATEVEETTATLNGDITNTGGENCDERGFLWATSSHGDPGNTNPYSTGYTSIYINNGSFGIGAFNYPATSLLKGTKHYYRAWAHNSGGWAYGSEQSFTTKPDAPTGFTATAMSTSQIDLSWTVAGTGAEKTRVRRSDTAFPTAPDAGGDEVYFDTGTGTSDTGLTPETTYYYSAWSWVEGSDIWSDTYATAEATTEAGGPPSIPDVVGDYSIKGSIKPFDWKNNKGIVVQGGTLHIHEQDGHKIWGYFEPSVPIEGWPSLQPVEGYVGPFERDDKGKIKNKPRLSLLLELGQYCKYTDEVSIPYVTYIVNGTIKWDKKLNVVKSIKCTINGWGEYRTPFEDASPSQGQFEGKFTATPIPGGTIMPEGGIDYIEYAQDATEMAEPGSPAGGPPTLPVIPLLVGDYPIKGSVKFFDWKCNKGIVVQGGTLHITEQDAENMHKIKGYWEPGVAIDGWPTLVPVKGYVGPLVRDLETLKVKNKPRLSLMAEYGAYCQYPTTKYVTYILNGTIKWDKTERVKSIKCTINGWGEFGAAFDDESPSLGQFEGKFTATAPPTP